MTLLCAFYLDADLARRGELLECLRRNEANPAFDEVHLWLESPGDPARMVAAYPILKSLKIRLIAYGQRVTYLDLFNYANRSLAGCPVAIANADIYFDDSVRELNDLDLTGKLLCLSRWDIQPDGTERLFDHPFSQDAWIFAAPIREFPCDFHLGVPGCDNRLAFEARRAGLTLSNPAKSIRAFHLHLSGVRRYSEQQRIGGPASGVAAGTLEFPRQPAHRPGTARSTGSALELHSEAT